MILPYKLGVQGMTTDYSITDMKISRAQENDIPELTCLVNAAYKELADMGLNYTATNQKDEKTKERIAKGRCFIVKEDSGKIVGTILLTVENYFTNRHTAYISQFGILPEFKKNGLGTRLMQFCEELAREEKFEGVQLDTAIPARHLVNWYLKTGYEIVGKTHWDGKTYDSYVFEKKFYPEQDLIK